MQYNNGAKPLSGMPLTRVRWIIKKIMLALEANGNKEKAKGGLHHHVIYDKKGKNEEQVTCSFRSYGKGKLNQVLFNSM